MGIADGQVAELRKEIKMIREARGGARPKTERAAEVSQFLSCIHFS